MRRIFLFHILFSMILSSEVQAASELSIYKRCYFQLTGRALPLQSPVIDAIRSGQQTGAQGCMTLLELATLNGNGMPSSPDAIVPNLLTKMEGFHRTWFPATTVEDIQGYNDEVGIFTRNIFDATEPSVGVTYALLRDGFQYKNILAGTQVPVALRRDDPISASKIPWTVTYASRGRYGNNANFDNNSVNFARAGATQITADASSSVILNNVPRVQTGEFLGIIQQQRNAVSSSVHIQPLGMLAEGFGHNQPGLEYSFNIFRNYGGGLIGSPIYLMTNWGHTFGTKMNGTSKLPRRWAENTLKSFLCISFPNLRAEDSVRFVVAGSQTPFRKSVSCVGCHATMDRMATVLRNKIMVGSDFRNLVENPTGAGMSILMTQFTPSAAAVTNWPADLNDPNYHRQNPQGTLYFRGFDGRLVEQSANSLEDMAGLLTQQPEFYQCAAKRYVHFLTGYDVNLYDKSDSRNEMINRNLTEKDKALRTWVEQLGAELQNHQSLKRLIQSILLSPVYQETVGGKR